jgi:hypothetical protein
LKQRQIPAVGSIDLVPESLQNKSALENFYAMAICPICAHDVRTPFFTNLDAWTHLRCANCSTRLEMKPPRSFVLAALIAPFFVLARHSAVFECLAFSFAAATCFLVLFESFRPKLRIRKKAPAKAEVWLKINRAED